MNRAFWQSKANQSAGVEDMVLLTKVVEDQIVENLKKRYLADAIYTYIGPTLVALVSAIAKKRKPIYDRAYHSTNQMKMEKGELDYAEISVFLEVASVVERARGLIPLSSDYDATSCDVTGQSCVEWKLYLRCVRGSGSLKSRNWFRDGLRFDSDARHCAFCGEFWVPQNLQTWFRLLLFENLGLRQIVDGTLLTQNPYKKLPYFTSKEIQLYRGAASHENPPHIYALTDTMFQHLVSDEESQCVIISGESGAGKTESAKLVMNYLAAVSGRGTEVVEQVKRIILESNPLLEAFGNAKTLRNNNSSRFGKYFEIAFSRGGQPVGGTISNFLLEKSRVVGPSQGERNFHVFYQLTKAASTQEKKDLGLSSGPQYFNYLNCSKAFDADGIDDAEEYQAMRTAMGVCKIAESDQSTILAVRIGDLIETNRLSKILLSHKILAGVLHLGNLEFDEDNNHAQLSDQRSLAYPAFLLGIQENDLQTKLTSRYIETGRRGESYNVPLNAQQARTTRDALAKALYTRMFDWIVSAVNNAMLYPGSSKAVVLGVLDIYVFQKNGYQQFSINYVNERLQQIFIELTLKNEQEEYAAEGIKWEPIPYFNNRIVVDLIEAKRPPGIFSVLDDVCATMHAVTDGADSKFVEKLGSTIGSNKHLGTAGSHFTVHHYAGSVDYDSDGFVESNKDSLFRDLIILGFIKDLFPESVDVDDKKRPTTGEPMLLTDKGVKENIKVRRAGFCYRGPFDKFLKRYAILTKETYPSWRGEAKSGIKVIMDAANLGQDQWQLGKTKVFIKAPESLFLLEELRERKFDSYAKTIQRHWRKAKARKHFVELRKKAVDILYKQKERRRESLDAEFIGDHLGNVNDNATLKALVIGGERSELSAEPDPKNKNVLMKVVKRKIILGEISGVMLSRHADNFVVIHASDYSTICECPYKTELITILSENYLRATKKSLFLNFSDTIQYTTKKTGIFQGSAQQTMNFVSDTSVSKPVIK
ncbi:Unconventional myosin-Ie, partial [Gonapodya sp. JEL0774]